MTGMIVAAAPRHAEAFSRGARTLRTTLGPAIATFPEDPSIVEVMLNPDGRLWIDRLSGGLEHSGRTCPPLTRRRRHAHLPALHGLDPAAACPRPRPCSSSWGRLLGLVWSLCVRPTLGAASVLAARR